tara:strand:+ start:296 stop:706 length:411 start_codon:yes stop_codon:yes gene_type:complete
MPLINSSRNISPLDINKNIRIGVALPLNETNIFKGTNTVKEQAKTNLINVLLTEPGERVYEPTYGVGLKQILFEQNPNENDLTEKIKQQTSIHIPEISLVDTSVNFDDDQHILYVTITYMFNLDRSMDSIQLNFNS